MVGIAEMTSILNHLKLKRSLIEVSNYIKHLLVYDDIGS